VAPNDLDSLLALVGVLGADAAWLLRWPESATLAYEFKDEAGKLRIVNQSGVPGRPLQIEAVLIAHFGESDIAVPGLEAMRLPPRADREIQVAALLSAALDALTRLGPEATARVLTWACQRYGISNVTYQYMVSDRRPRKPAPPPAAAPPEPPAPVAPVETRRPAPTDSPYKGVFVIRNAERLYLTSEWDWSKRREDAKVYKLMAWAERVARDYGGTVEKEA